MDSIDEIYASFQDLDDLMNAEEREEFERSLAALSEDLKEQVIQQFKRLDYMSKELNG